jgi:Cytochrome c554 and c-prime
LTNLKKLLIGILPVWQLAAQQSGWIGAKACAACHPAEFSRQSKSAHAASLFKTADHPLAARFGAGSPPARRGYHFSFPVGAEGMRFRADDGKYVTEVPVQWAFGAGEQAVTFLSKVTPDVYLELAFTYYTRTGSFDLTPRHEMLPAATLHEAMGQPVKTRTAGRQCFGCHSTGPVTVSTSGDVNITEAGVRCESCHGPGGGHRDAALKGNLVQVKRLIRNPHHMEAGALNTFCGTCHRVAANLAEVDWSSPWSVRHQPPYLARSRCFQKSGGRLSCLTCHEPHEPLRRQSPDYYRSRCVSCHSAASHPPARACLERSDSDCTLCHMPAVRAGPHLMFRNHQIGIYDSGAVTKARR